MLKGLFRDVFVSISLKFKIKKLIFFLNLHVIFITHFINQDKIIYLCLGKKLKMELNIFRQN